MAEKGHQNWWKGSYGYDPTLGMEGADRSQGTAMGETFEQTPDDAVNPLDIDPEGDYSGPMDWVSSTSPDPVGVAQEVGVDNIDFEGYDFSVIDPGKADDVYELALAAQKAIYTEAVGSDIKIEKVSSSTKNAIAAQSSGKKIPYLDGDEAFDELRNLDISLKSPVVIGVFTPPTNKVDNRSKDVLATRRFERSLSEDNVNFLFKNVVKNLSDFESAEQDVENKIVETKSIIDKLSQIRNAIDDLVKAFDIRNTETSKKVIADAMNSYLSLRAGSERIPEFLPDSINEFFVEYLGISISEVKNFEASRLMHDIYTGIVFSGHKHYPGLLYSSDSQNYISPDALADSNQGMLVATEYHDQLLKSNIQHTFGTHQYSYYNPGAAALESENFQDSYVRGLSGPRGGQHSAARSSEIYNLQSNPCRKRALILCSMLSSELIVSAGLSRLVNTALGSRGGANNSFPFKNLISAYSSIKAINAYHGSASPTSKILDLDNNTFESKAGSLQDAIVLNEQSTEAPQRLVMPFEMSNYMDNNAGQMKVMAGREFFLEAPFRGVIGDFGAETNIEKFSKEYDALSSDAYNYLRNILLLDSGKLGIEPAEIYAKCLSRISNACDLWIDGLPNFAGMPKSSMLSLCLFLQAGKVDLLDTENSVRSDLFRLCLQYRDTIDAAAGEAILQDTGGEDDEATNKLVDAQFFQDPRYAVPNTGGLQGSARRQLSRSKPHTEVWNTQKSAMLKASYLDNIRFVMKMTPMAAPLLHTFQFYTTRTGLQEAIDFFHDPTALLRVPNGKKLEYGALFNEELGPSFIAEVVKIARELQASADSLSDSSQNDSYLKEDGQTRFNGACEDIIIGNVLEIMICLMRAYLPMNPRIYFPTLGLDRGDRSLGPSFQDADAVNVEDLAWTISASKTDVENCSKICSAVANSILSGVDLSLVFNEDADQGVGVDLNQSTDIMSLSQNRTIFASEIADDGRQMLKSREFQKLASCIIPAINGHLKQSTATLKSVISVTNAQHPETKNDPEKLAFAEFCKTTLGKHSVKHMTSTQASLKSYLQDSHQKGPQSVFSKHSYCTPEEKSAVDILMNDPLMNDTGVAIMMVGIPLGMMSYLRNPSLTYSGGTSSNASTSPYAHVSGNKIAVRFMKGHAIHEELSPLYGGPGEGPAYAFDLDLFVTPGSISEILNTDPSKSDTVTAFDKDKMTVLNNLQFSRYSSGKLISKKLGVDLYQKTSEGAPQTTNYKILVNHTYDYLIKRYLFELTGMCFDESTYKMKPSQEFHQIDANKKSLLSETIKSKLMQERLKFDPDSFLESFSDTNSSYGTTSVFGGASLTKLTLPTEDSPGKITTDGSVNRPGYLDRVMVELTGVDVTDDAGNTSNKKTYAIAPPRVPPAIFDLLLSLSKAKLFSPDCTMKSIVSPNVFDRVFFIPVRVSHGSTFEEGVQQRASDLFDHVPNAPTKSDVLEYLGDLQSAGVDISSIHCKIELINS